MDFFSKTRNFNEMLNIFKKNDEVKDRYKQNIEPGEEDEIQRNERSY